MAVNQKTKKYIYIFTEFKRKKWIQCCNDSDYSPNKSIESVKDLCAIRICACLCSKIVFKVLKFIWICRKPQVGWENSEKRHILMTHFPTCLSQPAWAALTKGQDLGGLENQTSLPTALRLMSSEALALCCSHHRFSFRGNASFPGSLMGTD